MSDTFPISLKWRVRIFLTNVRLRLHEWREARKRRRLFNRGFCPECEDIGRGFICPICRGVKIRPFTKEGRKTVRDRYLNQRGIDLFTVANIEIKPILNNTEPKSE